MFSQPFNACLWLRFMWDFSYTFVIVRMKLGDNCSVYVKKVKKGVIFVNAGSDTREHGIINIYLRVRRMRAL